MSGKMSNDPWPIDICPLADFHNQLDSKEQYSCNCCETFVCNRCERRVSWDFGCADDMPALCDDCSYELHQKCRTKRI